MIKLHTFGLCFGLLTGACFTWLFSTYGFDGLAVVGLTLTWQVFTVWYWKLRELSTQLHIFTFLSNEWEAFKTIGGPVVLRQIGSYRLIKLNGKRWWLSVDPYRCDHRLLSPDGEDWAAAGSYDFTPSSLEYSELGLYYGERLVHIFAEHELITQHRVTKLIEPFLCVD